MKESIENEFITWHAFPHVPEYEIMDPYDVRLLALTRFRSSIEFGITMSNDLKKQFNKTESVILSTNDVWSSSVHHGPRFPVRQQPSFPSC